MRCRFCNQAHHSSLHMFPPSSNQQSSSNASSPSNTHHTASPSSHTVNTALASPKVIINNDLPSINSASLKPAITSPRSAPLPTALVKIRNKFGSFDLAQCLLDSGSQCSFVSEHLVQRLGLIRHRSVNIVNGLGNKRTTTTKGVVQVELSSRFQTHPSFTVNAFVVPTILSLTPVDFPWSTELDALELADPNHDTQRDIDVLLGSDIFFDLIKSSKILIDGHTAAQETSFGWILLAPKVDDSSPFQTLSIIIEDDISNILQRFWEVEEPPSDYYSSSNDSTCEKIFCESISQSESGHYQIALPFKSPQILLGHSKSAAVRRLFAMEKKFIKDHNFADNYRKFMKEYLDLGHMEMVPHSDLQKPDSDTYYLPHHAVLKAESTTTKLRVVFDGSSKSSSGFSLNDALLVGPTLQPDLVTILMQFRKHAVAIAADIEKMYRQILVAPPHNDFQRIVWRDKPSDDIGVFRLNTVTYGTSSAPFLAVRTLNKVADDISTTNSQIAQVIKTNFYVDDLLSGAESSDEAFNIFRAISTVLEQGGFKLRKWKSNSEQFLSQLPDELKDPACLNFSQENVSTKTLGIQWHPHSDTFGFAVNLKTSSITTTKRELLSQIATIFDPMGWLSPTTISLKLMFQSLWTTNLGWDDTLPTRLNDEWLHFKETINDLSDIQIPRFLSIYPQSPEIQVHGFADASEKAYAAVIYFRVVHDISNVSTSLVIAKTKVAPLKQLSLPRLELSAAYLLSKLIRYVKNIFKDYNLKITAWSDSTIVLSWLSDSPRRWKVFVGNRTASILGVIPRYQWRHVPSQFNPADCASRGMLARDLARFRLWWHGPEWLTLSEDNWPKTQLPASSETLPEKRPISLTIQATPSTDWDILPWLEWKSSFSQLCRIVAYIFRLHARYGKLHTVDRIRVAERCFVHQVQQEAFSNEINCLKNRQPLNRRSSLINLTPFLDSNNILRVGGRLDNLQCNFDVKHPMILPSSHRLTEMIVREYHVKNLHPSASLLLSLLRQRYWIVHGRQVVRSFKCVRCFRYRQKTSSQLMGQLPKERITPCRPFTSTGVDYAGPIQLRTRPGRTRRQSITTKGYIALFICLTTKAVHIELVSDMTAEAFIAALRRFVARRGYPSDIISDNGTNFVGAARELAELHELFQTRQSKLIIDGFFTDKLIRFHFNPPNAPHFGGLWEANIKSIKHHLKRVTQDAPLTFEEMTTLLTQIEALLNSRPLCPINSAPDDFDVLTPGTFLLGEPPTTIPEPDVTHIPMSRLSKWQYIQQRVQSFWARWSIEYLNTLQQRPKWKDVQPNLSIDDLVLVIDNNLPPSKWLLARIIQLHPGTDNLVRVATIKTQHGELKRPIVKLCRLPLDNTNQEN